MTGSSVQQIKEIIEDRERILYEGLTASSAEILDDVMSDDFVHVHPAGIAETKQDYLTGLRSGVFRHGPIRRVDGDTLLHGDMAITAGAIAVDDPARGAEVGIRLEQTLIWVNEHGTWRVLLRQATRALA